MVETENTGITKQATADVTAEFFGTTSTPLGGDYDKYAATDSSGKQWCFVSDSSVHVQSNNGNRPQAVKMVTPILHYENTTQNVWH